LIVGNVVQLKVVFISAPCMCNSYRNGYVVQSVGGGGRPCVCLLSHMLEKVENAWFTHSRRSNKNVKSSDGGIPTLQM